MSVNVRSYAKYIIYVLGAICLLVIIAFNFILYPIKYKNEITIYSNKFGVERALVASVIAAESSFNTQAKSSKGAIGLMQIMPTTAKWLCGLSGDDYNQNRLFEAEYNIKLGTYYLMYLTNKFTNINVVIAAYNAGEGVVSNWLKSEEYSTDGKTLIKIPYKETANYLNKVTRGINIYKDRF